MEAGSRLVEEDGVIRVLPDPEELKGVCLWCGAREVEGYQQHTSGCLFRERQREELREHNRRRARLKRWLRHWALALDPRRVLWAVQDMWDWVSFWILVVAVMLGVLLVWLILSAAGERV